MASNDGLHSSTKTNDSAFLSSTHGVLLFALCSCFLWGSAFPCTKVGNGLFAIARQDTASQLLFAGVRFVLAGTMVIAAMSVARGRALVPKKRDWSAIARLSLFQTILQYGLFYPGLSHASGTSSSIIEASSTFLAIILAAVVFRQERLTPRKVIGCLVGFAGVALVNVKAGGTFTLSLGGEGLVFFSTFAAATSSCLIQGLSKDHDPVLLSGWQFLVGGLALTLAGAFAGGTLSPCGPEAIALLVYMGFISAAAYSLWSMLLSANPVSRVTVFGFMNPVFGAGLSALILGERASIDPVRAGLALALVSAGIVAVNLKLPARSGGTGRAAHARNELAGMLRRGMLEQEAAVRALTERRAA
ncbi:MULTISPECIES: DMT family transporter [Atopobiaceae]|uniref:Permease of the drug/metabolite transporter (DMT) superfamily n=1 Tax=Parafannyhessea umbonata TaxID=604330 RepID=A0A1H6IQ07_9ACTN|nr:MULTISPECIES: DMT family transporter [Atopobiaceae]SEH51231.1 Permease of the drug/metabolite transporter (DMT) superfamily [Parafannyhessea umbonata]SJZ75352.1 Permease of the drug/metabolite transporter (DMT) superfamily [Olsenella sp. KH1P3]